MRQHLVLLAVLAISATACADASDPTGPSLPLPTPVFAFVPGDGVVLPPQDTVVVPGDSIVFPPDTVVVPGDTVIVVPSDTIVVPDDSVVVPGDSVVVPPAPWYGFVTGGGFIASPAGAYAADARAVGKGTFGLVVKSKEGRAVPEGNVEFQFHGARFDFKGHDIETLSVVGSKAIFTGPGSLNGVAGYAYAVTVVDGRVDGERTDRFRIRIWNRATGAVAYDSQVAGDRAAGATPSTALSSGSIVIHAK